MTETVEEVEEVEEVEKDEYILTDEMREKALKKPVFDILYIGDGDSRLSPFRGESVVRTFAEFYSKQANISYYTADSKRLAKLTVEDAKSSNIIWIDNVSNFTAARNLSNIIDKLTDELEPGWGDKLKELTAKNPEEAEAYAISLRRKRQENLRIVYCLDEFVWEGVVGRAHDIKTVHMIESYMTMADCVIVPNGDMREIIKAFGFVSKVTDVYTIPTSVNPSFFQLYRDFSKRGQDASRMLKDKPKVLIKGLAVPENVEDFIMNNYKKMDITLCSIDNVNDHIKGLIGRKKINHVYHWANPYVHKGNIIPTYATERDYGYDFVIHTKADNLMNNYYEITTGDEDILFSIAYGALPICGYEHLGYDENVDTLYNATKLTFGKDDSHKKISKMIEMHQSSALFNEKYNVYHNKIEQRITTAPFIIARYYRALLGEELTKARNIIAKEKQEELNKIEQEKMGPRPLNDIRNKNPKLEDKNEIPENVVEGNFGKEG